MFYAMCVGPYEGENAVDWSYFVRMREKFDLKRWTIAIETGRGGYRHWQVRIASSGKYQDFFDWSEEQTGGHMHVEESKGWSDYERKEGCYITSEDTDRIFCQRFGTPRWYQKAVLQAVRDTNDREIVVWYDPAGNVGKSWLCSHLFETGQANVLNPMGEARKLVQDVCSMYVEGGPEILVINIPRTWKWTKDLLVAIETIKDGLLSDPRYSNTTINRDLKVLVCTNDMPKLDGLSADRWTILQWDHGKLIQEHYLSNRGKIYSDSHRYRVYTEGDAKSLS